MRSDRVYEALRILPNRFMLCSLAFRAARRFHRPDTSIGHTINDVLDRIARSTPGEELTVGTVAISSPLEADRETRLCA